MWSSWYLVVAGIGIGVSPEFVTREHRPLLKPIDCFKPFRLHQNKKREPTIVRICRLESSLVRLANETDAKFI